LITHAFYLESGGFAAVDYLTDFTQLFFIQEQYTEGHRQATVNRHALDFSNKKLVCILFLKEAIS